MAKFLVIVNEDAAQTLKEYGFICIEEKINKTQKIFKFVNNRKINKKIKELFVDCEVVENTNILRF